MKYSTFFTFPGFGSTSAAAPVAAPAPPATPLAKPLGLDGIKKPKRTGGEGEPRGLLGGRESAFGNEGGRRGGGFGPANRL